MSQPPQEASSKGTVLVTGANGYIAGQVILTLLSSGYAVRGTVRSLSRSKRLLDSDSPFYAHAASGRFELVEVPDITAAGAFDAALSGGCSSTALTSIVHLAQPVVLDSTDAQYLCDVAVQGTLNLVSAAATLSEQQQHHQQRRLKSFVFMSSIAAIAAGHHRSSEVITADMWSDLDVRAAGLRARGRAVPGPLAYGASKTAAERALWRFRAERAPRFAVAAVHPGLVAGPAAGGQADVRTSGGFVYAILAGGDLPPREALLGHGAHVDVRDVARLTAFAVEHPHRTDGRRLLAASSYVTPLAVAKVLREAYPERRGVIKGEGEGVRDDFAFPEEGPKYDTQTVVELTGQDWIPFKKTLLDAAKAYEVLL
ncbi:NAD dependent epimerase/dehydratase [Biscogniauxia mediterranea]|nr:NAD dependent epimerase/dehydratase [Biscogniauxia mediterranea]